VRIAARVLSPRRGPSGLLGRIGGAGMLGGLALIALQACARSTPVAETSPPSPAPIERTTALGAAARMDAIAAQADGAPDASTDASPDALPDAEASLESSLRPSSDASSGDDAAAMLLVPAGSFTMGADRGGEEDERPAHEVTLAAFYLDRTEVTNEAYEACVRAHACPSPDRNAARANHAGADARFRRPRQPVVGVSWHAASAYCAFRGARLPREAEWERAARDADGRRYPWGNEPPTPERAVFGRSLREGTTDDVATHPEGRGPYGHEDLAGNVWEWMNDEYDPYAYKRAGASRGEPGTCRAILAAQDELRRDGKQGYTGSNPIPTTCEHVLRGGAFNYDAPGLRTSNRVHHPGTYRLVMAGFRCAKDAVEVDGGSRAP
jgi:formylglycine-generating enzyme required for sulfatase activity